MNNLLFQVIKSYIKFIFQLFFNFTYDPLILIKAGVDKCAKIEKKTIAEVITNLLSNNKSLYICLRFFRFKELNFLLKNSLNLVKKFKISFFETIDKLFIKYK